MESRSSAPEHAGDTVVHKKRHDDFVAEIHKCEVSSSENFDKSILTMSSTGLAISIGFLKDFVLIQSATAPWMLYGSWGRFTLATCSTMVSFLASSKALSVQKNTAYRYYIDRDEAAWSAPNPWDRGTRTPNLVPGGAFL